MKVILIKKDDWKQSQYGGMYQRCYFKGENNESLRLDVYDKHNASSRWEPYLKEQALFDNVTIYKDNIINGECNFTYLGIQSQLVKIFQDEFEPIRKWAQEKGIYDKGDAKTQYIKLQEEAGELAKAILKNDSEEFIDAIGDCVVVLTNLAKLNGYNIEDCINSAYNVIAKRKGSMQNGTFVKNA